MLKSITGERDFGWVWEVVCAWAWVCALRRVKGDACGNVILVRWVLERFAAEDGGSWYVTVSIRRLYRSGMVSRIRSTFACIFE